MATKQKPSAKVKAAKPQAQKPKAKRPPSAKPKHSASKAAKPQAKPPADTPAPDPTVAQQRISNGEAPNDGDGRGAKGRFVAGNTFGFKPGQSGNPAGPKPGSRIFQQVTNEMLLEVVPGDSTGRLWVRALVEKAFIESLKGGDKHLALIHRFTGEGQNIRLTHDGEVTVITPEAAEAKRQARWAQVAPALALAQRMGDGGEAEDSDMAADMPGGSLAVAADAAPETAANE